MKHSQRERARTISLLRCAAYVAAQHDFSSSGRVSKRRHDLGLESAKPISLGGHLDVWRKIRALVSNAVAIGTSTRGGARSCSADRGAIVAVERSSFNIWQFTVWRIIGNDLCPRSTNTERMSCRAACTGMTTGQRARSFSGRSRIGCAMTIVAYLDRYGRADSQPSFKATQAKELPMEPATHVLWHGRDAL